MVAFALASLRHRLVALLLLAALPAFGLAVYTYAEERRQAAQAARADALRLARLAARVHEQRVGEAHRLLLTVARLPEAQPPGSAACGSRLAGVLREFTDLANLGVAAADGEVVCSAVPLAQPVNVAERPWFDRAVRTRAFAVGDFEVDASSGQGRLVVALPLPYPGGGTQTVVFAVIDLAWLGRFGATAELPAGWVLALSDDRGTILARHPEPWRWVGQRLPEASVISAALAARGEGTAEVAGADGVVRLFGFTPVPGRNGSHPAWMSVAVPRDTAFAEANWMLGRNLAGLVVATAIALAAAWIGSEWLVLRRVTDLTEVTGRLAAGDLEARAEVSGQDEISGLARALNAMASRLGSVVRAEREARHALAGRVDQLVAERTQEVELLRQLSELLQASASPDDAYLVMAKLCAQLFRGADGAVLVIPASRTGLDVVARWGGLAAAARDRLGLDECWALRRGRVYRVDRADASPPCPHLGEPVPAAFLCVPLAAQGETLGLFTIATGPGAPDEGLGEARARLAVTVAEQFALALANLRLRATLHGQSIRDPLTGLFNRRYMEETLDRELSRAKREGRPLALVILDIDRFKGFNDTFGHEAGDAVLEALGALLRGVLRAGDVACRYGGEEFVLILPAASLGDAQRRAEEIREAIRTLHVFHAGRPLGLISCSMGVAGYPEHGAASAALLRAADAALYRAKREGRDQVALAD
jgi:diguanylate cyclase (GGDEF)-like protein